MLNSLINNVLKALTMMMFYVYSDAYRYKITAFITKP